MEFWDIVKMLVIDAIKASMIGVPLGFIVVQVIHILIEKHNEQKQKKNS